MRRFFDIIASSFRMALQELLKNKLRTFLSLFGITIGIFCIIGVLSTVQSLEHNLQQEIKSLGTNTIYIDKWDYAAGGGPDYPWWKFVKRPSPKYSELEAIKQRTPTAQFAAFQINTSDKIEVGDNIMENIRLYGITQEFSNIQPIDIAYGRYMTESDFDRGTNAVVMGHEVAEKMFGEADRALGKLVSTRGKKLQVVGVIKKQGKQMIGGWGFDQSIVMSYRFARSVMDERRADPLILVQGRPEINNKVLKDDLRGAMRSVHKLSPMQDDDFALNDINDFSDAMSQAFVSVNIGGWAIAALSLIVGMFGVANIMFVTVKERTSQIGLKKAIGAKKGVILTEFLLESAFLCIIGGIVGIALVFIGAQIVTRALDFPIFISTPLLLMAVGICIAVGLLAGIIPAYRAANLDPVVAIRS
jgi:putative ABC transport system permease protein